MGDRRVGSARLTSAALLCATACTHGATPDEIALRLAADSRLEPLVPIFEQCAERRATYQDEATFFRSDYGAVCGSVMVTFGVVSAAQLADYWQTQ